MRCSTAALRAGRSTARAARRGRFAAGPLKAPRARATHTSLCKTSKLAAHAPAPPGALRRAPPAWPPRPARRPRGRALQRGVGRRRRRRWWAWRQLLRAPRRSGGASPAIEPPGPGSGGWRATGRAGGARWVGPTSLWCPRPQSPLQVARAPLQERRRPAPPPRSNHRWQRAGAGRGPRPAAPAARPWLLGTRSGGGEMGRGPKGPVATLAPGQAGQDPPKSALPAALAAMQCMHRPSSRRTEVMGAVSGAKSRARASPRLPSLPASIAIHTSSGCRAGRLETRSAAGTPLPPPKPAGRRRSPARPAALRSIACRASSAAGSFPIRCPAPPGSAGARACVCRGARGPAQQGYSAPTVTERCDPHRARSAHWPAPHSKPSIIHPTPPAHLTSTSVTLPCSTRSVAVRSCGAMASSAARSSAARRRICEAAEHRARPSAACPARLACRQLHTTAAHTCPRAPPIPRQQCPRSCRLVWQSPLRAAAGVKSRRL